MKRRNTVYYKHKSVVEINLQVNLNNRVIEISYGKRWEKQKDEEKNMKLFSIVSMRLIWILMYARSNTFDMIGIFIVVDLSENVKCDGWF